jgi:hypothetical protein
MFGFLLKLSKLLFFFTFLLVIVKICNCQCNTINLIRNPSLEEYSCCPTNMSMIGCADFWTQPNSLSTSDYFNTCAFDSIISQDILPYFMHSKFGNGYAGIICNHFSNPFEYREYLQGKLSEQLLQDKCYHVEFWTLFFGYSYTAIDALGIFFTDTLPKGNDDEQPFIFPSQINNLTDNIISDTINWTKIKGNFYAHGGEIYFTVGTFKLQNEINTIYFRPDQLDLSYYFFDNFSLCPCEDTIPLDTIKPPVPVFEVYPNPAKDELFVLYKGYEAQHTLDLSIYNILGELVLKEEIVSNSIPTGINITQISAGCYVLVIKSASKTFYKERLVIIR